MTTTVQSRQKKLTQNQQKKLELLEASLGLQDEGGELLSGNANIHLCASIMREEKLQYSFMLIYQIILLILSLAVLGLLLFAAWRVGLGEAIQGVIAGAGALISGTAAAFLVKQVKDARDTHAAAQAALEKHSCPG